MGSRSFAAGADHIAGAAGAPGALNIVVFLAAFACSLGSASSPTWLCLPDGHVPETGCSGIAQGIIIELRLLANLSNNQSLGLGPRLVDRLCVALDAAQGTGSRQPVFRAVHRILAPVQLIGRMGVLQAASMARWRRGQRVGLAVSGLVAIERCRQVRLVGILSFIWWVKCKET